MRALYLFINGLASSNADRPRDRDLAWDHGDDVGLTPIRPGAFARWMTARDACAGQVEGIVRRPERGRRAFLPR